MNKRTKPDLLSSINPTEPPPDIPADKINGAQHQIIPTPTERRELLVNATEAFMLNSEQIDPTKARQLAVESVDSSLAKGIISLAVSDHDAEEREALAPPPDGEAIEIPTQYAVRIYGVIGGGVEVRQEGQHCGFDDPEADAIEVSPGHVVELARKMLNAAGFPNVEITAGPYSEEIKDGQTAAQFDFTPPAPAVFNPSPPQAAPSPPAPKAAPEPPYNPFTDRDDPEYCPVVFEEQRATAIYRNPAKSLVIRQDDDEDTTVVVSLQNIPAFIKRVAEVGSEAI